ncbi:MAG: glutamine--fructose-6-phosphate transaminase (isomerizing) [Pseudomonadota bacterium]
MCGIVGILAKTDAAPTVLDALKRLEYRGYDSAGICTQTDGMLDRRRAEGKLVHLAERLKTDPLKGLAAIGHTRWATHGPPIERNAHPHLAGSIGVVHNGIIENFLDLRQSLEAEGHVFETDTDTEVIAHLIDRGLRNGQSAEAAFADALQRLQGAYALAVLYAADEDLLLVARRGSPLAVGLGEGEVFVASDAYALAPMTNRVIYLEEGDWGALRRDKITLYDEHNAPADRPVTLSNASAALVGKGNHRHFMAKEIHEQPDVIAHALGVYLSPARETVSLPTDLPIDLQSVSRISIVACGTAAYAGYVAKYWIEPLARVPVDVDIASEFRYREPPLEGDGLTLVISQSGETADTLAALRYCKAAGQKVGAIINVEESSIAREADFALPIFAGPEIGVASTKAFTCQLTVLAVFSIALGRAKGTLEPEAVRRLCRLLQEVPRRCADILAQEHEIERLATQLARTQHALFLGRGSSYPLALEGALKLKEISYIHAEGYAAGELKHGPIALIDESMPVIMIAPFDELFEKTASNLQEVTARGGKVILISDKRGLERMKDQIEDGFELPALDSFIMPLLSALPIQLLAYHTAVFKGTDVDQPRNLAKSVTVE